MDTSVRVSRNSKQQILSVYLINFFLLSEVYINFEMKMVENSYSLDKNSKRGRTNTLLNKMVVPAFMRPRSPARKRALSAISLSRSFGNFLYIFSLLPLHKNTIIFKSFFSIHEQICKCLWIHHT